MRNIQANLRTGDEPQDLFDAIVEAYGETNVTISINSDDFDYTYRPVVVSPEFQEAALVATSDRNGGVEFMTVEMSDGGLKAFDYEVETGMVYIGSVYSVRESEY